MTDKIRRPISLTEEQWRQAKSMAALRGQTVSQWFAGFIDNWQDQRPKTTRGADQTLSPAGVAPDSIDDKRVVFVDPEENVVLGKEVYNRSSKRK